MSTPDQNLQTEQSDEPILPGPVPGPRGRSSFLPAPSVALPTLPTNGVTLPKTLQEIRQFVRPGETPESDRPMSSSEILELQNMLRTFHARVLDQHRNEFHDPKVAERLMNILEWCVRALTVVEHAFVDTVGRERRRNRDDVFEVRIDEARQPLRSTSIFERVREEMLAERRERELEGEADERRRAARSANEQRESRSSEAVRKVSTLAVVSPDQALIGELNLLLVMNRIPSEQIDDVMKFLRRADIVS